jgi:hypothetical protein
MFAAYSSMARTGPGRVQVQRRPVVLGQQRTSPIWVATLIAGEVSMTLADIRETLDHTSDE